MVYHFIIDALSNWVEATWCCLPKQLIWVPTWDGNEEPPDFPPLPPFSKPPINDPTDWSALYRLQPNREQENLSPQFKRYHMEADLVSSQPNKRQKRSGSGPKPLSERTLPTLPTKTPKSYTRERKLQIISYITNKLTWVLDYTNIPVREGLQKDGCWRPLNNLEMERLTGINSNNIRRWWISRDQILTSPKGSRRITTSTYSYSLAMGRGAVESLYRATGSQQLDIY